MDISRSAPILTAARRARRASRLGDYEKLAEYLTGCGYSDGMTQKLFCDSWMKVVKACTI